MRYQGGKSRLAKRIAAHIDEVDSRCYVEPFVGGASVLAAVRRRPHMVAVDIEEDIINMWKAIQNGWQPPLYVSEDQYRDAKGRPPDAYRAFVAHACSWGAARWGGYARGGERNFAAEACRKIDRMRPALDGVEFVCASYDELFVCHGSVIYCDPPYAGTKAYSGKVFDHERFWRWCDEAVSHDCTVFVSELQAPPGWQVAEEISNGAAMATTGGAAKRIEYLFKKGPL